MVTPGVHDYLKLPLESTTSYVQSRMKTKQIVEPQVALSTDWEANGLGFGATLIRGLQGHYLVITQGRL